MEVCRVECEGSGVRFFSFAPGTIDNDFRRKTHDAQTGGYDEIQQHVTGFEKWLIPPQKVVERILHYLSLNPSPQPLIPYFPFSLFLNVPPTPFVLYPQVYWVPVFLRYTPLGWLWFEPSGRRKYGLPA